MTTTAPTEIESVLLYQEFDIIEPQIILKHLNFRLESTNIKFNITQESQNGEFVLMTGAGLQVLVSQSSTPLGTEGFRQALASPFTEYTFKNAGKAVRQHRQNVHITVRSEQPASQDLEKHNLMQKLGLVQSQSVFETKLTICQILAGFFVRNSEGKQVPLSAFVTIKGIAGPDFTNRFNLYRAIELTGASAPGYTSAQTIDALEQVAKDSLPGGMGYAWSNMSFQEKKSAGTGGIVILFSLLFVFLILAAQYESWSLPLSILLGTPFAIFGAFLALYLARMTSESYELNVFAQIALVMLIGMAAKNAILIIEFANIEFHKGLSLFDAAIKAARLRFRPILMTAFSFILGVMPLVVASGAGAEARVVMGVALLGGMTIATLLGVFFYPMLFVFIGKLAGYEKKREITQEQEKIINDHA